jgi:putative transposase
MGISRNSVYYVHKGENEENLKIMRLMDQIHLDEPTYGSPRMKAVLCRSGWVVNEKRVARLMRKMDIEAIYQEAQNQHSGEG